MRLLIATADPARRTALPMLADEQIVCGATHCDREVAGRVFSRATPAQDYDLAARVEALPADQRPDVVACLVSGATNFFPRNVGSCVQPKVLFVADPWARPDGLGALLDYARSERFDRIVLVESRDDAAALRAAAGAPVHWFPGLLSPMRDGTLALVRQPERLACLAAPPPHAWRGSMQNLAQAALTRAGLSPVLWGRDLDERLELFGLSRAVLLPSEHGELSLDWFAALAAGSVLLTTPPTGSSGFDRLWSDGSPFVTFASAPELVERVKHLWSRPAEGHVLGRKAAAWYDENLSEARRRAAFGAIVFGGDVPAFAEAERPATAAFDFPAHRRALASCSLLLEASRRRPQPQALLGEAAPPALREFAARISRMIVHAAPPAGGSVHWDFAALSAAEASSFNLTRVDALLAPGFDPVRARMAGLQPIASAPGHFLRAAVAAAEANLRLAREALESGEWARATQVAQAELSPASPVLDALLVLAEAAFEGVQPDRCRGWLDAAGRIDAHDPRLRSLAMRMAAKRSFAGLHRLDRAWRELLAGADEAALAHVEVVLDKVARTAAALHLRALLLARAGRRAEAIEAWREAVRADPNRPDRWFDLGATLWAEGRWTEAGVALRRAGELGPDEPAHAQALAAAEGANRLTLVPAPERDLLISMPETNRRHGTGVLLRRFFPDSGDFVTLRSATNYQGVEEFGGVNLLLGDPTLTPPELRLRLRRLLAPWRIRRILCVPFTALDFAHATAVRALAGAPLATYVMDDQNVVAANVPDVFARQCFAASDLRLTISPEMQAAYAAKYPEFEFGLMPPIVASSEMRRENRWDPRRRPAHHAVLVGNVWSNGQLAQLVRFIGSAGLKVDWFGRESHPDLVKAGLAGQGSLPEAALADRLTEYPFVIVPSGLLDGTEDNEWLTRLSLPSRMVFLLQTQTPMLVLGSPDTAASRFVRQLGVGRVVPYDAKDPRSAIKALVAPETRAGFLAAAARHADSYLLPAAGDWIWRSLARGRAQPAPFDAVYAARPEPALLAG